MARNNDTSGWVGWVYFAGVIILINAVLQSLFGFVALLKNEIFVVTPDKLIIADYTAWGWIHLIIGLLLFTAGFSILSGGVYGRVVGVILAAVSFVANAVFLTAYPVWSITAMVLSAVVIYALVVHGGEARE